MGMLSSDSRDMRQSFCHPVVLEEALGRSPLSTNILRREHLSFQMQEGACLEAAHVTQAGGHRRAAQFTLLAPAIWCFPSLRA